ncbi:hypothetical protein JCM3775_003757 [Rhodotorula graminis]
MDFANGFTEVDQPLLAPPLPTTATATTTTSTASTSTRPPRPQGDTLDLTEDSPEPQLAPAPARHAAGDSRRGAGGRLGGRDGAAKSHGHGAAGAHGHAGARAGDGGESGAAQDWAAVVGASRSPLSSAAGGGAAGSGFAAGLSGTPGGFAAYASTSPKQRLAPPVAGSSGLTYTPYPPVPSSSSTSSSSPAVGRVPVISSAANARLPSSYLPGASRGPHAAATPQGAKGKGRAVDQVLDLTADDGDLEVYELKPQPVSDDDDVVIDESPVCLGDIFTFGLVLNRVTEIVAPPPPPTQFADGTPVAAEQLIAMQAEYDRAMRAFNCPLPVHIRRDKPTYNQGQWREMLRLYTPVRHEMFGFVDYKAADILGPLLGDGWHGTGITEGGNGKLYCEAFVERMGHSNPVMMRLRLLLFARPLDVPLVATALESAHPPLWLAHPVHYNPSEHHGARYANPHNPAPGVGARGADAERRRQALVSGMYGGGVGADAQRVVKTVDAQREQVQNVLMDLKSGVEMEEVTPPPIVATKLYPHQKQALAFLLDRETLVEVPERDKRGDKPTMVALWERISDPYGRPKGWRSVVTDLQIEGVKPPPQARGAILADDMGLGKTIVIISLVCTTLPEAREWAKDAPTKDKLDPRFEEKLKAADLAGAGRTVDVSQFKSQLWGITAADVGDGPSGSSSTSASGKPLSKKKQAKQRREKKREEALQSRFDKLEVRSRATLIVCPLSTVQNWESQFEEHTAHVDVEQDGADIKVDEDGGKSIVVERSSKAGRAVQRKMRVADSDDDADDADHDDDDESDSISDGSSPEPSAGSTSRAKGKKRARSPPLKIYIYHGAQRCSDVARLADHDVVITTFSTVGTEFSKQTRAEEEREDEEEKQAQKAQEEEDGIMQVFGFAADGSILERPPGELVDDEKDKKEAAAKAKAKNKRKRKRVEGSGVSPLQAIQWFRVVLDEAHIIKEHKTIQARAACELSTSRRICLSGTPLQNSLNDIFSLVRFLRLEPFLDRHVWNQYIGVLAQKGDELGTERLQAIMRYIALRRTKDTKDTQGKPILSLPPINNALVHLKFTEAERAFYASRHQRYKHDFAQMEANDSVMKNFCSILQELLKLRQICVHPALLQDTEDRSSANGGDLVATIEAHGISKSRAIQLLALMRDAGGGDCSECGCAMQAFSRANVEDLNGAAADDDVKPGRKPPAKRARKTKTQTGATSVANSTEDDGGAVQDDVSAVVTRCQHVYCTPCFKLRVCPEWPDVKGEEKVLCQVCAKEILPALDAVEIGPREYQKALERSADEGLPATGKGKKGRKPKATRLFEHSTKTRALLVDLLPFSQVNPHAENYNPDYVPEPATTIGFQPVQGEIVKSVVFSQWTTLLDRLGDALEDNHIQYDRLDGGMNRDQRSAAMAAFKADPKCEVLLVSLRAGGVGLNLTAGRRVYLMEPFWNPAVENQAVDRIYRLGQTHSVQTVRFVMQDSIETNMLKIQKRKMELASMSIGRTLTKLELQAQRKEELRILLG